MKTDLWLDIRSAATSHDGQANIDALVKVVKLGSGLFVLHNALHEFVGLFTANQLASCVSFQWKHLFKIMLIELMASPRRSPRKDVTHEARYHLRSPNIRDQMKNAPEGNKVGGVRIVLDVTNNAVRSGTNRSSVGMVGLLVRVVLDCKTLTCPCSIAVTPFTRGLLAQR